ncbi:hypothetical protein GJ496_004430 [Pomphorhynchus laevis]|nr:hypothetical protein GJ496_004430 [Pomphorhynchus laevis]
MMQTEGRKCIDCLTPNCRNLHSKVRHTDKDIQGRSSLPNTDLQVGISCHSDKVRDSDNEIQRCASSRTRENNFREENGETGREKMQSRVSIVNDIFNNVKFWTPNLFYIPRSSSGSEFVDKVAELFELASSENENSKYELAKVTVILQLILQRPLNGKICVCRKLLTRRIKWWNDGRLDDLLAEAKYLQQKQTTYGDTQDFPSK